jgi:hypothetical protein
MGRVTGATAYSEDLLTAARALHALGMSWRKIATILERTDRGLQAAVERAENLPEADAQQARAAHLEAFHDWLSLGRARGFLALLPRD